MTKFFLPPPKIKNPIAAYIIATVWMMVVVLLLLHLDYCHKKWLLKTETASTHAVITFEDSAFHDTAHFDYKVGGKVYHSDEAGWASNTRPGELVSVHYNPNDPMQATLGDLAIPTPLSQSWPLAIAVGVIAALVFASYHLIFARSK